MMRGMRKYFLTGFATLLPLAVTVYVVHLVVRLLTKPFMGFVTHLLSKLPIGSWGIITSDQLIKTTSQVIILISLFLFLLFLGIIARWFFVNALIHAGERLLHRIPLVNKVYRTAKEIIHTLFASDKNTFKQVVLIQFPHKDCYCIGLITKEAPKTCSAAMKQEMVSVFIPTAPNPTTGFMTITPVHEMIHLDMKTEEALKYVVSCGVIHPGEALEA